MPEKVKLLRAYSSPAHSFPLIDVDDATLVMSPSFAYRSVSDQCYIAVTTTMVQRGGKVSVRTLVDIPPVRKMLGLPMREDAEMLESGADRTPPRE